MGELSKLNPDGCKRCSRKGSWPLVKDPQAILYDPKDDVFFTEKQAVLERRK